MTRVPTEHIHAIRRRIESMNTAYRDYALLVLEQGTAGNPTRDAVAGVIIDAVVEKLKRNGYDFYSACDAPPTSPELPASSQEQDTHQCLR